VGILARRRRVVRVEKVADFYAQRIVVELYGERNRLSGSVSHRVGECLGENPMRGDVDDGGKFVGECGHRRVGRMREIDGGTRHANRCDQPVEATESGRFSLGGAGF